MPNPSDPPQRIRVLHVINSLGFGGAERLVLSAACGLPRERFESAVCCLVERGDFAAEADAAGIPVWCAGGFPGFRHPGIFLRLRRHIRAFQPAIVHTHLQSANLYGRLAALAAGVPVLVATEHNVYRAKARRYIVVERLLARRTSAIVAVSEEVRRFLAGQLRLAPASIRLIRNGVARPGPSTEGVERLRRRVRPPATALVLGTVASLTGKKGHRFLIEAVAALNARGIECSVLLAGDGPERANLEALVHRLQLASQVHFLGNVPRPADVLGAADLFVLPSIVEGLPLALLEAMRAGTPVVATAVGGVPEAIVSGVNGLLVEPRSAGALAAAIERMARSADVRRSLAARARETADREFSEDAYLARLASAYIELVESPHHTI